MARNEGFAFAIGHSKHRNIVIVGAHCHMLAVGRKSHRIAAALLSEEEKGFGGEEKGKGAEPEKGEDERQQ